MLLLCVVFIVNCLLAPSLGDEQPYTTTPLGAVVGHYQKSYGNRTFAAFEGIPYGKPPVGDLRFAGPRAAEPWTGIWNATASRVCPQLANSGEYEGEEDCLYLNVYVPKDLFEPNAGLDTIVHIHGGAFKLGSPEIARPGFLMDRDIVYVSINYRLGILGFLSTQDDVVPGNNGLKDQVLALQWVQSNIEHFGGNPNSVTIIGLSAGGGSVHLHYLSPQSKGLFHRAIAQSLTAISPLALQEAPLEAARRLAVYSGCYDVSTKDFIECIKQISTEELIEQEKKFYTVGGFPLVPFGPVVERPSDTAFIADYPYRLLDSGKINDVPLMMTLVTEEGIIGYNTLNNTLLELNEHWNEFLPDISDYRNSVTESDMHLVADKIKTFYFDKENITDDEDIHSFIKLYSDRFFKLDFERCARIQAKVANSSTYTLMYGYKSDQEYPSSEGLGVSHLEDSILLYTDSFSYPTLSQSDEIVKEVQVDMVTSFAKTGKPEIANVDWKPVVDTANFTYLYIHEPGDIQMVSKKEIAPTDFWRSLPIKEYEKIDSGHKRV